MVHVKECRSKKLTKDIMFQISHLLTFTFRNLNHVKLHSGVMYVYYVRCRTAYLKKKTLVKLYIRPFTTILLCL